MIRTETIMISIFTISLLFTVIVFLMNVLRINDGLNFFSTVFFSLFNITITTLLVSLVKLLNLTMKSTYFMILIVLLSLVSILLAWRTRKYMKESGAHCRLI